MPIGNVSDPQPFIAGKYATGFSDGFFPLINPATGETIAQIAQSTHAHLNDAVASAREAQRQWYALKPDERVIRLWKWGEALAEHGEELAQLDTMNTGRPINDTRGEVSGSQRACRYWAGMSDKVWGDFLPVTPGHISYSKRIPIGVVGVILPWNAPLVSFVERVAPVLACGNGVIVKPSEYSPSSALRAAEIALEAGMPAGLINVLTGDGSVGAMLAEHAGVDGISFTGSVPTGRLVNQAAASTFKIVTLEMGGKSPNIVFADADLEQAAQGAIWGVFAHAGQICCNGTRLLVQRSIADEFTNRLRELASRIRMGDPMDESVHIGPIVSAKQYERVCAYLDIGTQEATMLTGMPASDLRKGRGFYVPPTIFTEASATSRIAQEEIFGPILTVLPFDDLDEAVTLAHSVKYGLSANVWTRDAQKLLRLAEELDVGTVWGNATRVQDPALPYGGFRESGMGNATGAGAIEANTKLKRASIRYDPSAPSRTWDL
jgi:acyl-CoA reductase-like NAD-dependent aldehyde dehydrogenase